MPTEAVRATYRVQLHRGFDLDAAAGIIDYLSELGISHLYCSPYLQARPGSTHGYDVVDHSKVGVELGGTDALDRMIESLSRQGMGHILDVVPNHMTITERANAWWWDVLKNGPYSDFAGFFDINWDPNEERLRHNILLPILGDHYGRVLDKGEIKLELEDDGLIARYYEHVLPISPGSVGYAFGADVDLSAAVRRANEDTEILHSLLELQYYRIAYWKTAGQELNYRRFFAINDLAALRMENPEVFERVHKLVLEMVRAGRLDGLRIDHIDGLRYPTRYLRKLRTEAPDAYLCVEKILEVDEAVPDAWPIEGSTGYDFLNRLGFVYVDQGGVEQLTDVYHHFIGEDIDVQAAQRESKLLLIDTEFGGEFERLTDLFVDVCESHRQYRDYTRPELREALREVAASFPVYRTYIDPDLEVSATDRAYVDDAIAAARSARPDLDGDLFDLLASILLLEVEGAEAEALAVRFQQTTGPVVAKGLEDTFFYRYNRLISLNEVGGDPARSGTDPATFHEQMTGVQRRHPLSLLASSTHDTKRSEDVRARISLLSEIPERWAAAVTRWSEINAKHKRNDLPDRNAEYLLYQTLVGAWPLDLARADAFMQKAAREAKMHTSWIDPKANYETSVRNFLENVIGDRGFQDELASFVRDLVVPGWVSSLSQTLVKLTAPGIPDIYQGCEVWNYSLVDPDNRREVDYDARRKLLKDVAAMDGAAAWAARESGAPKLYLTQKALRVRKDRPESFGAASTYQPLSAAGAHAGRILGYLRGANVATIAPRLVMGLGDGWADTSIELPDGTWTDVLGGGEHRGSVSMTELTESFPCALLVRAVS